MRLKFVCLGVGLALAASGCSKKPVAPAETGSKAAAPSGEAAAPSPGALLAGRPMRKPGLWKMTIATDSGPGIKLQGEVCLTAETDKSSSLIVSQGAAKNCGKPDFSKGPEGYAFDSTCTFGGRTVKTHGVATGDFSSAYHLDISSRMDPPLPGGKADVKTHIDAQWEGPCKPGQTPGKMSMKVSGFGRG